MHLPDSLQVDNKAEEDASLNVHANGKRRGVDAMGETFLQAAHG
jgi:hypothetical protein